MFVVWTILLVIVVPFVVGLALLTVAALAMSMIAVVTAVLPVQRVPLRYNLRNLQARWLTTAVTGAAVILVVAALTGMFAFVRGMDKLTEGSGHPGNVLILSDGATDEAFSNLPSAFSFEQLPAELQKAIVRTQDGKFMGSKEVYVIVTHVLPNPEPGGRKRRFAQMRGVDNPRIAAALHDIELAAGDWFASTGEPEVVLGDGVAKRFGADHGKATLVPGDTVQIGPLTWKVTGVMKPNGSAFASEIWTHDAIVQERFGRLNSYTSYVARTANAQVAAYAAVELKKLSSERSVQAMPERQYYAKLTATNDQFRFAAVFVGIVMALGGILGVMITMFAAVSQRTKDLGVLRLLGYTRFQILCSLMLESLVIGLLAGGVGVTIAYFLFDGWATSSTVASGPGGGSKTVALQLSVGGGIVLVAMVFSWFMGAVGGFIPAVNAMRLKPLESLR